MHAATHSKETIFHDNWAASVDVDKIDVSAVFESPTALENRFILGKMGNLHGKRVLDIGCGLGESSVYFAKQGADVLATDISDGMIQTTQRLATLHGVEVEGRVGAAENLDVPQNAFDFVYSANTLHHVADRDAFLKQICRALKPGGEVYTWDPLAYNPVINIYRRMATAVRTVDEEPLTFEELRRYRKYFTDVGHREFWITGLSLFLKYYALDGINPNAERYWKKIYGETEESIRWWMPLRAMDAVLSRVPGVRRMAWNIVIWGRKGSS